MTKPRKSLEPYIKDSVVFYDYQIDGIRKLARWKNFLLADDPGLGKTLSALTVFCMDVKIGCGSTLLVVAPTSLKQNWADEIEKHTRLPSVIVNGPPILRAKLLLEFEELVGPKVLIMNYEQVQSHLETLNNMKFNIICFDEAHYLKNPQAKRTKASLALMSDRCFLLTGTPMLNRIDELWTLLHKINPAAFPRYWSFLNRYAVTGGFNGKSIVGVKNESELTAKLHSVMLRRKKDDVLSLDTPTILECPIHLYDEQRAIYNSVNDELIATMVGFEDESIENPLVKFLRLKQVCGSTFLFNGRDISAKLDRAIEDDKALIDAGEKIIVFTQFRTVQTCYTKRLRALDFPVFELHGDVKVRDRQGVVNSWTKTKGPALIVCMIQVAGLGLNMVAASNVSFLDKLFSPGLNKQAIDRCHRIGQVRPVIVRDYLCVNTIESRVNQILSLKQKLNDNIVDIDAKFKKRLIEAALKEEA